MGGYEPSVIENKWQARWYESGIWKAEVDPSRPKFFMIFAYPGVSGYLHVGHMRGYTYTDILTRYKRMKGFNVLFPVGAHATGNISISFARRVERGDPVQLEYLRANGCPPETIEKLKDPAEVVRYFGQVYVNDYWKRFGFLVDWRRFMTTVDPGYNRFIQWQFLRLHDRGLLVQKPYYGTACLECGPVAVDASETDISSGGNAEKQELTLLKFRMGDGNEYLVAATLRPETVYGQTNFWVNPETEYVRARVGDETWIISPEAAEKLGHQRDDVEVIGRVPGRELVGMKVKAPMIDRLIPVLPSRFCDPDFGTGMVTSVPSDAPFDWIALKDLMDDPETCKKYGLDIAEIKAIEPIPIIDSKGWGPSPAVEICERMGIENQDDPRLEEATKEIYKAGFHTGRMNDNCGEFAGMPVSEAKDRVKERMVEMGVADIMYELSEPVTCRCGGKVIVKRIPDQWFIKYSDENWTARSKEAAAGMEILPGEYYDNLPGILDWFGDRACVRLGNWLGTRFPLDDRWIIEPISDSTLYPSYYTISHLIAEGRIRPEDMTPEFFDAVFLGRRDADVSGMSREALAAAIKEFEYWYPLDINLGGKEHMTVHFPVFLMNHVAIMEPDNWPRGILVNWYIMMTGGKISKSKGGAQPIPDAAARFSVDGMRLYYAHVASPFADVEWSDEAVMNYRQRTERLWNFVLELADSTGDAESPVDAWLLSRMHNHLAALEGAMDRFELREAANTVYYDIMADIRWYLRRGGGNAGVIRKVLDAWLPAMCPFTPHLAEELWERTGHEGMLSAGSFPSPEDFPEDDAAEAAEFYLGRVKDDISQILRTTGIRPGRICVYVAPEWKRELFSMGLELAAAGRVQMGDMMKRAMAMPGMKEHAKEVSAFCGRFVKEASKLTDADRKRFGAGVDEHAYLLAAREFLEKEMGCRVDIYRAGDPDAYDPQGKSRAAYPFKPAIYVE